MNNPKTVLVVDGSHISRLMLRAIIENYHGDWQVMEADEAAEARRIAESNAIDFIVLDFTMPGIDDLSVAAMLKHSCPQAKMALLTGHLQEGVRVKAENEGALFIPRPVSEEKILSFIASS